MTLRCINCGNMAEVHDIDIDDIVTEALENEGWHAISDPTIAALCPKCSNV